MKRQLTIQELMSKTKLSDATTVVNDNSESSGECSTTFFHTESNAAVQLEHDSGAQSLDTIGTCTLCLDCYSFNC